jgi:hypothetical protein
MSRICTAVRRPRLDAVARSAQRWIGGGIAGHRATSPARRRISRRDADAAALSSVTPWGYLEGG